MALITNTTLGKIRDQIVERNILLRNFVSLYATSTWDAIQLDAKTMTLEELAVKYPIGTIFNSTYTYNGTEYDMPWRVVAHRKVTKQDGYKHNAILIQSKYATIEDIQIDETEGIITDDVTAQDGYYYCGKSGDTFTMLAVSAGDTIPYSDYDSVLKGIINDSRAYKDGYNRYKISAARQWLNSSARSGEWWTSQHYGNNAPSQLTKIKGFMAGLTSDFLAVIDPILIKTVANNVTDGRVIDETYDRFFIPSVEEMYGISQVPGEEGSYFPYWKDAMGLSEPINGASDARLIKKINAPDGDPVTVWLRSASQNDFQNWYVHRQGTLGYFYRPAVNCPVQPVAAIS